MEHRHTLLRLPNAPANLVSSNVLATNVDLDWDAVVGASGYNVYRDDEIIATPSSNSYSDTDVLSGETYEYYVTAVDNADADADNESGPSNTVTVTIP